MRRWAVTGPAGGGKSAFCGFLAECGAAIVSGDSLGHEILERPEIALAIGSQFGREVVAAGEVDRAALGKLVFADPHRLEQLNRITHGPLAALAGHRLEKLETEGRHRLAVLEAAVYFALPQVPGIELVITVTASETTRLARLTGPGGLAAGNARRRISAQESLQEGWAGADVVLNNEGTLADLQAAAAKLWSRLED